MRCLPHPARSADALLAILEQGQHLLEVAHRGVIDARVDKVVDLAREARSPVFGALEPATQASSQCSKQQTPVPQRDSEDTGQHVLERGAALAKKDLKVEVW